MQGQGGQWAGGHGGHWALGLTSTVILEFRALDIVFLFFFSGYSVRHVECWFPYQGLNLCPCSGSVESKPLNHQGSAQEPEIQSSYKVLQGGAEKP